VRYILQRTYSVIVSASTDGFIRVWNIEDGSEQLEIDAGPMGSWIAKFSADQRFIVTGLFIKFLYKCRSFNGSYHILGSQGGKISLYGVETGQLAHSLECPNQKFILCQAFVSIYLCCK
jgi:WD40 repeat protein